MPLLNHDGLSLHYEVHGTGRPVLLLHGGTVNFQANYAAFGWVRSLTDAGFQVIGLDFRGHGQSAKPHEVSAYGAEVFVRDVLALLDHLQMARVSVVGYSLGSVIALHLLKTAPQRLTRAVLMATGDGLIGHPPHDFATLLPALSQVLERDSYPRDLPKHLAAYWNFVQMTGGDRAALRALAQAPFPPLTAAAAAAIAVPTLVLSGELDPVLGRGPRLAAALGQGQYREIAGADHFALSTDLTARAAVLDFLAG